MHTMSASTPVSGPSKPSARRVRPPAVERAACSRRGEFVEDHGASGACMGFVRRRGFVRQQEGVEYLARNRRRGAAAVFSVLDEHGHRQFRILRRSERNKQSMIEHPLRYLLLIVFLVLSDAEDLRGSGLARDLVGRAGGRSRGGAAGSGRELQAFHDDAPLIRRHGRQRRLRLNRTRRDRGRSGRPDAVTSRGLKIWPREAMPDTACASCMGVASM